MRYFSGFRGQNLSKTAYIDLLCNILNRAFVPAKRRCCRHELIINCLNAPTCLRSVLLRTAKTVLQRGTDGLQFLLLL